MSFRDGVIFLEKSDGCDGLRCVSDLRMGVDETICLVCGGSTFVGETIR